MERHDEQTGDRARQRSGGRLGLRRAGRMGAAVVAMGLAVAGLSACGSTTPPPASASECPLPAYPTAACTGVPEGTQLTTHNGDLTVTQANQVVDGVKVTGELNIRARNVVVKNSEIQGRVINDFSGVRYPFTIEDSTVKPAGGCSSWGNGAIGISDYTARRVEIAGFPDGFRVAGSNILIEDSFVTVCSANPEDHSDGIQAYGAEDGTNVVIRHNTIDQRSVTNGAATSPIFIPNDGERQFNQNLSVSVTDNLLAGGGYSLRVYGELPWSASAVTGNKIVDNSWAYGPLDVTCSKIGDWSGNATVTYDWATGKVLTQVKALNDCA